MNMQHKQRLDTQALRTQALTALTSNFGLLRGLDEEIGCLRSKTSDYLCLTAGATGSLSLGTENGDAGQRWEMRDDGVLTNQMGLVLDVIWADVPLTSDGPAVMARNPDTTLSQKWRWSDCLFC